MKKEIMTAIIAGIVVASFVSYFSGGSPEIFLENGCDSSFNIDDPEISLTVRNRGNIEGYASICLDSQDVIFTELGNISSFCYTERRFSPIYAEFIYPFKVDFIIPNEELPNNLTIKVTSTCNVKVWGFIPKYCQGFTNVCEYEKGRLTYTLIN